MLALYCRCGYRGVPFGAEVEEFGRKQVWPDYDACLTTAKTSSREPARRLVTSRNYAPGETDPDPVRLEDLTYTLAAVSDPSGATRIVTHGQSLRPYLLNQR